MPLLRPNVRRSAAEAVCGSSFLYSPTPACLRPPVGDSRGPVVPEMTGRGAAGRVGDHNILNFSSRGAPDVLTCLPKFFREPIPQFGVDVKKEYTRLQEATLVSRPCIPQPRWRHSGSSVLPLSIPSRYSGMPLHSNRRRQE